MQSREPEPTPSVQAFRISDALRCALLNAPPGPNLACPRESLAGPAWPGPSRLPSVGLWKDAVLQPKDRVALAGWQGLRLAGLVSARARPGGRAWGIDGLYLPAECRPSGNGRGPTEEPPDCRHHDFSAAATGSLALLEELCLAVGQRSAERVFLRLAAGSPALSLARRSGFVAGCNETLLAGPGRRAGCGAGPTHPLAEDSPEYDRPGAGFRPRRPADDYGLFQLFCASTPVRVRQALGLTFDQWRDARELDCRRGATWRRQEWVAEHSGRLVGWVQLTARGRTAEAEVMAHPDYPELLFRLVDFALARAPRLRWLVPDYREAVSDRLRRHGFRETAQYIMLVKLVAVPALRYGMAPVEA